MPGIPGKEFLTDAIYDHILRGEDRIVQEYCKLDCLDTLLTFFAWAIHMGDLEPSKLQAYMSVIRETLAQEEHEGWKEIATKLAGWPPSLGATSKRGGA